MSFSNILTPAQLSPDPIKRLHQLAEGLRATLNASGVRVLTLRCGKLFVRNLARAVSPLTAALPSDQEIWKRGARGSFCDEQRIVVPIRLPSPDPLSSTGLAGVLIIEPGSSQEGPVKIKTLASRFAELISAEHQLRLCDAHRRLAAMQVRAALSTDACYQVAREIRHLTGFDGLCRIWLEHSGRLEVIAAVKGDRRDKRRMDTSGMDKPSHLSALLSRASITADDIDPYPPHVFVKQTSGTVPLGLLRTRHTVLIDRSLPEETKNAICRLLADTDKSGLGDAGARIICPLVRRRTIQSHHEIIGVMILESAQNNAFSASEAMEVLALTPYCVPALEREIAVESEFEVLEKGSLIDPEIPLRENRSLQVFLNLLCDRFRAHRNADIVTLLLYDKQTGRMRPGRIAIWPPELNAADSQDVEVIEERIILRLLQAGEKEWDDSDEEIRFGPDSFVTRNGIKSFFAVPLKSSESDVPIGLLCVDYKTPRHRKRQNGEAYSRSSLFTRAEKDWIRRYAQIAAQYLTVLEKAAKRQKIDRTILDIYRKIETTGSLRSLLEEIFLAGVNIVEATAGTFAVPSPIHNDLDVAAHKGFDEVKPIRFGEGVTGKCAERCEPIVVLDATDATTWPAGVLPLKTVRGSKSELAVPLLLQDGNRTLVGVLDVEHEYSKGAFRERELQDLKRLADAGALAIGLFRNKRRLAAIRELGDEIRNLETEQEILVKLLEKAVSVCEAYSGSVRVPDSAQTRLEYRFRHGPPGTFGPLPIALGESVVGYAMENRMTVVIRDVRDQKEWQAHYPKLGGAKFKKLTRSELAVRIHWGGDLMGILNLEHTQPGWLNHFKEFVEVLAHQAAFSLYNLRKFERQRLIVYRESVEGISVFARTVRHDLRSRFQKILGETENPSEPHHGLARIADFAFDGLRKADRLIEMAEPLERPVKAFELVSCVRNLVAGAESEGALRSLQIKIDCSHQDLRVTGREPVLAYCIIQILDNSKFYGAHTVRVSIGRCKSMKPPEAEQVEIRLVDDGPGVTEGCEEEIYAWEKERLKPKGRGEAMALCRLYIRDMRGEIWSKNHIPQGLATFIRLPSVE